MTAKYVIELDDYELANLRSLWEAAGCGCPDTNPDVPPRNSLHAINTGDWFGQIWWKLPKTDHRPNITPKELALRVSSYVVLVVSLLLCGCLPPIGGNTQPPEPPPATAKLSDVAESALRKKAALMAKVARDVAAKRRAGEFREYADLQTWEAAQNAATKEAYADLIAAQDARLKRVDGNLEFSADPEADAAIWDETAEGFERVANGR